MNTIEPSLRFTILHMEVAQDLWNDIKERFSVANGPRIQQLKAELVECKQKGMTIVAYYGKLKKLWEELGNFDQIPTCSCGLYTCNFHAVLERKREEEKIHQFLMGLDDTTYGIIRSNLLAQDPLLNLNNIYSTLVQEERVHTVSRAKEERGEMMAFAVQTGTRTRDKGEGKDKNTICGHCHRSGHDSDNCFQILGYPDWWGDRPRGIGKGSGRGKSGQYNIGSAGKGRGLIKANVAQVVAPIAGGSSGNSTNFGTMIWTHW
nr:hypothetical protein KK1_042044 [Cajanus cajan]